MGCEVLCGVGGCRVEWRFAVWGEVLCGVEGCHVG